LRSDSLALISQWRPGLGRFFESPLNDIALDILLLTLLRLRSYARLLFAPIDTLLNGLAHPNLSIIGFLHSLIDIIEGLPFLLEERALVHLPFFSPPFDYPLSAVARLLKVIENTLDLRFLPQKAAFLGSG